jgi:hypothetical protein
LLALRRALTLKLRALLTLIIRLRTLALRRALILKLKASLTPIIRLRTLVLRVRLVVIFIKVRVEVKERGKIREGRRRLYRKKIRLRADLPTEPTRC